MKHTKRHAEILRIVRQEGTTTIADLAARLEVSQESIRRDVRPLTASDQLLKVHGAVTVPSHYIEAPFEKRMRESAAAKRAIASAAAAIVKDGDSLMFDTGTTTSLVARELRDRNNLTIVTNSSDIARTLATEKSNAVFLAGGTLHGDNGATFGAGTVSFLKSFSVRYAFISIGAIDAAGGAMDFRYEEAEVARAVLSRGETSFVVTDQSKFNRRALVHVCDFDAFDVLICDEPPPDDIAERLKSASTHIQLADAI